MVSENFSFWFPTFWTWLGPSSLLHEALLETVGHLRAELRQGHLEVMAEVAALKMALMPPGEPDAETPRDLLLASRNELRSLVAAVHETKEQVQESRTDLQVSTSALLEILSEVQQLRKDGLKIQRVHGQPSLVPSPGKARPKSW
ncbi:hypothetical protein OIDMADRAFT_60767 [Oidiodendron maius Zn]|uniref:Uncharacterized protein n=1 Tax=Oidiodendron maius (strain Zn) TaxID=913774 RepID=A0A0C3GVU3_OIDMZ|nr:hypothetical protein OIDMADRAFT_60767 [Oidiodendron maius Zn]